MRRFVLDASVVLKWFSAEGSSDARAIREDYEAGRLAVVVPSLLFLEILNVAVRRWRWEPDAVVELVGALGDLSFEVAEPQLSSVGFWASQGLTAYDAAYVALAEKHGLELVTDDEAIVQCAPQVALPLAAWRRAPE